MGTSESYYCKVDPIGSPSRDCIIDEEEDVIERVGMPESGLVDERPMAQVGERGDGSDVQLPKYTRNDAEGLGYREILLPLGDCIVCKGSGRCFRIYE